jgi:hypothetical protein
MSREDEFGVWSWVAVSATTGAAVAITEFGGLRGKWEDVIVFTVLLFTLLALVYRSRWGRAAFWGKFLLTLTAHVVAVGVVLQSLPIGPRGIPSLVMMAVMMAEAVLIVVLWDRGAGKSKRHRSD